MDYRSEVWIWVGIVEHLRKIYVPDDTGNRLPAQRLSHVPGFARGDPFRHQRPAPLCCVAEGFGMAFGSVPRTFRFRTVCHKKPFWKARRQRTMNVCVEAEN